MPLRDHKPIILIGGSTLLLILAVAVISHFWPRQEERFFELGLLGKDKKAEGYYENDNSTLEAGSQVSWFIYVHNHMGSSQEISVRVKLVNSTTAVPDDREHEPSSSPFLVEFPLTPSADETLIVPFSWSILDAAYQNGSVTIERLTVNNETVEVNVPASFDNRFRMVFELWVYDQSSHEYTFGWKSDQEFHSASVYMWFMIALPAD